MTVWIVVVNVVVVVVTKKGGQKKAVYVQTQKIVPVLPFDLVVGVQSTYMQTRKVAFRCLALISIPLRYSILLCHFGV